MKKIKLLLLLALTLGLTAQVSAQQIKITKMTVTGVSNPYVANSSGSTATVSFEYLCQTGGVAANYSLVGDVYFPINSSNLAAGAAYSAFYWGGSYVNTAGSTSFTIPANALMGNNHITLRLTLRDPWSSFIASDEVTIDNFQVLQTPGLGAISNQTYCNNEIISSAMLDPQIKQGTGYYVTWSGGAAIGLSDTPAGNRTYRSIPSFQAKSDPLLPNSPNTATITYTAWYFNGVADIQGLSYSFTLTVNPPTIITGTTVPTPSDMQFCTGDAITMDVLATGSNLKYQWYKGHYAIAGATDPIYTIPADQVDINALGTYYVKVKGDCGEELQSVDYKVLVKLNVISQTYNDVLTLNCNPAENGGFTFNDIQWYKIVGGVAQMMIGENRSYLYIAGGFPASTEYFVVATTKLGLTYTSCPFAPQTMTATVKDGVYPNPVYAGGSMQVRLDIASLTSAEKTNMKIQIVTYNGVILSTVAATGEYTTIVMPNTPGVYVARTILGTGAKYKNEFKIIVK